MERARRAGVFARDIVINVLANVAAAAVVYAVGATFGLLPRNTTILIIAIAISIFTVIVECALLVQLNIWLWRRNGAMGALLVTLLLYGSAAFTVVVALRRAEHDGWARAASGLTPAGACVLFGTLLAWPAVRTLRAQGWPPRWNRPGRRAFDGLLSWYSPRD